MTAIEQPTSKKWVGQALRRKEDPRMITGRGRYVDDMVVPGMLFMAVVRSPEAHAKIVSTDASAARALPGIHGVFFGEDLELGAGLPMAWVPPGVEMRTPEQSDRSCRSSRGSSRERSRRAWLRPRHP
jgi:carbon-monoxide dehydrogenase large subunit